MMHISELWKDHAARRSFPLKFTSDVNFSPAIEGKGCIRRMSADSCSWLHGLVPRAVTEPLPWSCYYVWRVCVRSTGNSASTSLSEGKRLIWCRASKSKILCMTEILENTKKSNAKGHERRTDTARNLSQCSVFLIMVKTDSETLIRERIRNSIRMKNSGLVNMETLKHARYDFIIWCSLLASSLGELTAH